MKHSCFVFFLALGFPLAFAQTTPDPQKSAPVGPPLPSAPIRTTVTVNSTISSQTPASISVIDNQQLQTIPGIQLDDRLRQLPGFSLFRRSSSVVANPTTQGVSLRGIGSSGSSRTLILWDSIPVNDPFGGWVYWNRIDPAYVDRAEVERGGTTAVFGDRALSGSISLFTPTEKANHLFVNLLTGNLNTQDASAAYSNLWGHWGLTVHSRALTTDGYYIVPENLRGTADDKANLRFATGDIHIDYLGSSNRLSFLFNALAEERQNGTQLTHNSTSLGTVGVNYSHSWSNDQISFLAFHTREQFHSTFSSVSPNRNVETLTSRQTVPVENTGGAAYWQHHGQSRTFKWNSILGADVDDTHGISYDYSYSARLTTPGGGTLLRHSLFGQADLSIGPVRFFAGLRHQFTGQQGQTFVAPNGGIAAGLGRFRLRASGYRTFRAPNLNELYRNFRVGNALTLANPGLIPEGLTGVETGVDWSSEDSRISLTLFRNDLSNLITNSTLSISPNQILRQRTNRSSALSQGVEANLFHRWRHWTGEVGYLYADSRLSTGQRIAQVPKQQGTALLTYGVKQTLISAGIRSFGLQFDDDVNQFKLPGYSALQFSVQQQLTPKLFVVAAIDNLLDRTFLVALTPTPNIGQPRIFRVGLRWSGAIK